MLFLSILLVSTYDPCWPPYLNCVALLTRWGLTDSGWGPRPALWGLDTLILCSIVCILIFYAPSIMPLTILALYAVSSVLKHDYTWGSMGISFPPQFRHGRCIGVFSYTLAATKFSETLATLWVHGLCAIFLGMHFFGFYYAALANFFSSLYTHTHTPIYKHIYTQIHTWLL